MNARIEYAHGIQRTPTLHLHQRTELLIQFISHMCFYNHDYCHASLGISPDMSLYDHISDLSISAISILLNFALTPVTTSATHKGFEITTITMLLVARVGEFQHYH